MVIGYEINYCLGYDVVYRGQSGRCLESRMKERKNSIENKRPSKGFATYILHC